MDPKPPQIPAKKELTPEEKETVQSFEAIPFTTLKEKVHLILVWRKLKKGTEIILNSQTTSVDLERIRKTIEEAGLFCNIEENKDSKNPKKICFIANNQKDLESISRLWFGDHLDPEVYIEIGRMSGFPKTAVEAFGKNHSPLSNIHNDEDKFFLTWEEVENKIPENLQSFIGFKFSKTHWREELKTLKSWAEEIKLVNPKLYDSIVNRKHK